MNKYAKALEDMRAKMRKQDPEFVFLVESIASDIREITETEGPYGKIAVMLVYLEFCAQDSPP